MIKKEDVIHIASLARVALKEEELKSMEKDLGKILDYVAKLQELNVKDVPPTSHALALNNVQREDEIKPSLERSKILEMAVEQSKGFFKVPKVIE